MNSQAEEIARRTAARLAGEFDPELPRKVEAELRRAGRKERPVTFDGGLTLGIAIAALVVQVAEFAYNVIKDHRRQQQPLDEERLIGLIEKEADSVQSLESGQKRLLAETVAKETLKA